MMIRPFTLVVAVSSSWLAALASAQQSAAQPTAAPTAAIETTRDDIQILTRGPVHEAFAGPVSINPAPREVIAQQPPEPIEEIPPEVRPDNANTEWIPGYWVWDDDYADFLWVSGIWRSPPSGMRWVPGCWNSVEGGFQRAPGFWIAERYTEVNYLPTPPESAEVGPTEPAPSKDHFWVPGCWVWKLDRYDWRAGYWARIQPDWLWVPSHYVPTSRGCVFIPGYWDYPVARRGLIFAPAHFHRAVYTQPGFVYTPSVILNVPFLTDHLFVRPAYGHYYFGDYYGERYSRFGFQSWFRFQQSQGWYDPMFVHHRWQHRQDVDQWLDQLERQHQYFAKHESLRPRHTFAEQRRSSQELTQRPNSADSRESLQQAPAGVSVHEVLNGQSHSANQFQRLSDTQRREWRERTMQLRQLAQQRLQAESRSQTPRLSPADGARPELGRLQLPAMNREASARNADATAQRPVDRTANRSDRAGGPSNRFDGIPPSADPSTSSPSTIHNQPDLDRAPQDRLDANRTRKPLPGGERTPDRIPGGTPSVGPSDYPAGEGPARSLPGRDDGTLPDTGRPRKPLPGGERTPDRIPGGTPSVGPSDYPAGEGPARRLPGRDEGTLPDTGRPRKPLPGGERTPDRIPGGTPSVGSSDYPAGEGIRTPPSASDANDRRIPGTSPGVPGAVPGPRRPDLSPRVPQQGVSPRQPQNSAERQPSGSPTPPRPVPNVKARQEPSIPNPSKPGGKREATGNRGNERRD